MTHVIDVCHAQLGKHQMPQGQDVKLLQLSQQHAHVIKNWMATFAFNACQEWLVTISNVGAKQQTIIVQL